MNKIWLVTGREYFSRVKNKTFILTTILTPIGFLVFFIIMGFIMGSGSDKKKTIAVHDSANILDGELKGRDNLVFEFSDLPMDTLKSKTTSKDYIGVLQLLPLVDSLSLSYEVLYYSDDQLALDETNSIERAISKKVRNLKLIKLNIDESTLKTLDTEVTIVPKTIEKEKEISSLTNVVSSILGGIVAYILFFIILIYGSQVMRSVMEEKINRIVEVLISSVTPFQLMMGKVIGVGLVGLTQIGIWIILIPIVYTIGSTFMGVDLQNVDAMTEMANSTQGMSTAQAKISQVMIELLNLDWAKIVPLTLIYFFGGYFAYAAMFAAVGSAVGEDINEAQSLTFPIMLPLILAMYIGFSAVNSPDSSLVVNASMIPLLSSIVMPARLPFDPPWWQIGISILSLILFTIFMVWLAARIYRVGILMYGKKASFKELAKWMRYRD